jgi:hypothetical protein
MIGLNLVEIGQCPVSTRSRFMVGMDYKTIVVILTVFSLILGLVLWTTLWHRNKLSSFVPWIVGQRLYSNLSQLSQNL